MSNDRNTIRVASGSFEHAGSTGEYELYADGKNIFVKAMIKEKRIKYLRNQNKNFREDFLFNLNGKKEN